MKLQLIGAATIAAIAFTTPALADFYIVRDSPTAECRVVEQKPTDTKVTVVGNTVYKTREEATKQVTTVCKK